MPGLDAWKRRSDPAQVIQNKFQASLLKITADFLDSDSFHHALTKGEERETPLLQFLVENLPATYGVARGEVVDIHEQHSPQLDIMIYDKLRNPTFRSGTAVILPAEALLACIEVKSKMSIGDIEESFCASKKLHGLKPFAKGAASARKGGVENDDRCRYFYCVFAYESDLQDGNDWLQREYKRIVESARKLGIDIGNIDRFYVAKRGIINPFGKFGLPETSIPGVGLMHFYTDLLNFLGRENGRRKPAPYIGYVGKRGTVKL